MWPKGGGKVDVVAYYPWRATESIAGHTYNIDISDQDPQKDIDLMWSDNLAEIVAGDGHALRFKHTLSKLVFNVTDDEGASLEGMVSTFRGLPTVAGFNLSTGRLGQPGNPDGGSPVAFDGHSAPDGDGADETATVEAIVLPGNDLGDYTVTFRLANGQQAVFTVESPTYEPGKRYTYDIVLKSSPGESSASFGTDGELKSILDWTVADDGAGPHDVDKTDPDDLSGPWNSGELNDTGDYTISGDATKSSGVYQLPAEGGGMTIEKKGVAGVASVNVSMRNTPAADGVLIRSVRVGEHDLFYDGDATSAEITDSEYRNYFFHTAGEIPRSGDLVISIEAAVGMAYINGFGYNNADIP